MCGLAFEGSVQLTFTEVLRDKRRDVIADIERLRAEAAEIASRVAAKEGQLRNLDDLLAIETGTTGVGETAPALPARTSANKSQRFTDAAVDVLTERGGPIHYQELARLLSERDVYVPGKDPAANLIAHMLRDPRFGHASGRGMYGLASWSAVRAAVTGRKTSKGVSRPRRSSVASGRSARANG